MSWSKFTIEHIKLIKTYLYDLPSNSQLVVSIKSERDRIKNFIKINNINLVIKLIQSPDIKKFDDKIKEYANVDWVDKTSLLKDVNVLDINYLITWTNISNPDKNNKIYIKCDESKIKSVLKRIEIIVYMLEFLKIKSNNDNQEMNIYLILSNLTKSFPENKQIIGVKNANTGYTDFQKNIIFVWRHEEYEKVLFHEVIHFFDLDKREDHVDHIAEINGPHSYYEAITDVFGIYYHIIYLSLITKVKIKTLLEVELTFIRNQAMILNDYLGLGNWKDQPNKIIKQTTPAFSYYILKYLIFEYLIDHNINETGNYNELLQRSLEQGFKVKYHNKIKSSRMSLLQLE